MLKQTKKKNLQKKPPVIIQDYWNNWVILFLVSGTKNWCYALQQFISRNGFHTWQSNGSHNFNFRCLSFKEGSGNPWRDNWFLSDQPGKKGAFLDYAK